MSTAHRNACRRRSHLLAAAGSSFGHVQRNLLNGERSRHGPVPCAWQPDSAELLKSGQPVWRDPSTRLSLERFSFWGPRHRLWSSFRCRLTARLWQCGGSELDVMIAARLMRHSVEGHLETYRSHIDPNQITVTARAAIS